MEGWGLKRCEYSLFGDGFITIRGAEAASGFIRIHQNSSAAVFCYSSQRTPTRGGIGEHSGFFKGRSPITKILNSFLQV